MALNMLPSPRRSFAGTPNEFPHLTSEARKTLRELIDILSGTPAPHTASKLPKRT